VDAKTPTRKPAKDHTRMFDRTLAKKLAKDLNKQEDKNRLGFTQTNSKNKTEAKSGESKDRTEDGENKDHTKVFVKTHIRKKLAKDPDKGNAKILTGKLANNDLKNKTEAKGGKSKDRTEDGENKDHTRVFIKTPAGKLAKGLAKGPARNHTRKHVKDPAKIRGQDTEDNGGRYSYPLVDPRPEEVLIIDDSTVVQSTGAERSLAPIHVVKINPPYSQHTMGGAKQGKEHGDDQDATNTRRDNQHAKKHTKDPDKMMAKTLTGNLARDLAKRLAGMFAKGLARRLAGDLTRVLTRTLTGRLARDLAGRCG
jgi:hypothetical protein